jgi:sulfur carrier protein ThiS
MPRISDAGNFAHLKGVLAMAKINVMSKVLGQSARAFELDASSTISKLRTELGAGFEKYVATVDGEVVGNDYELDDGQYVTFTEPVKGGV